MKFASFLWLGIALGVAVTSSAQAPRYTAQSLGPGVLINDMNESGEVVGWLVVGPGVQAFVCGPNHSFQTLPLPAGCQSARARHQ